LFVTFSFQKEPEPQNGRLHIKDRIRRLLKPPQTTFERVELLDSFFTDVRIGARLCADEKQERLLRQSCRMALCAEGCELPQGFRFAVSDGDILRMLVHILCHTATEALDSSNLPLYCRCIAFIDPHGAHGALLEQLIKFSPEVIVYTENRRLYQGYADKVLEEYGAPIQFAENPQSLARASLALDTGGIPLPSIYPVPILTACLEEIADGNLRLWQPDWRLEPADAVIPPGINRYAFYAALHDRCKAREIYRLRASTLRCKNRIVHLPDIASQILLNQSQALIVR
jgi:hypothetical protein